MENILVTISFSVVAALFGILTAVIGWLGSRVMVKQDNLLNSVNDLKHDLHDQINKMGMRLVKVETKMGIFK